MKKQFLHVRAKVILNGVARTRTFWTYERRVMVSGSISFIECDSMGCNDRESLDAGNGGVMTIFVCKPQDIVWERPAHLDKKYNGLAEDK